MSVADHHQYGDDQHYGDDQQYANEQEYANDQQYGVDVDDLIDRVHKNIARRRREIEEEDRSTTIISNRFVTSKLSEIKGVEKHLNHMRAIKETYNAQLVKDDWSHGYVTRAELHQKYKGHTTVGRKQVGTFGD